MLTKKEQGITTSTKEEQGAAKRIETSTKECQVKSSNIEQGLLITNQRN